MTLVKGFHHIQMEGDEKNIFQSLNTLSHLHIEFRLLVAGIKS